MWAYFTGPAKPKPFVILSGENFKNQRKRLEQLEDSLVEQKLAILGEKVTVEEAKIDEDEVLEKEATAEEDLVEDRVFTDDEETTEEKAPTDDKMKSKTARTLTLIVADEKDENAKVDRERFLQLRELFYVNLEQYEASEKINGATGLYAKIKAIKDATKRTNALLKSFGNELVAPVIGVLTLAWAEAILIPCYKDSKYTELDATHDWMVAAFKFILNNLTSEIQKKKAEYVKKDKGLSTEVANFRSLEANEKIAQKADAIKSKVMGAIEPPKPADVTASPKANVVTEAVGDTQAALTPRSRMGRHS
jgi:hypothetical protein